jgi:hypothetical protein
MENNTIIYAYNKGYRVLADGSLVNKQGKVIKTKFKNVDYHTTSIRYYGKLKNLKVHRLQAYQKFYDKIFVKGMEVRHLNGNPLDNSWDNIGLGTASENQMDIKKEIRISRATYASSFLKKHNHEEISEFHKNKNSYKLTMEKFNISSKGTLFFILKKFKDLE